ncbi:MAG: outer membrane lipoprotein LolB [Oceanicoccus sp.]|jgi:outer membrane lipoprotein LolB
MALFRTTLLLSVLLISACSQQPTRTLNEMSANGVITQWRLSGKIGFSDGKQAHSAYLNWLQCGDRYHIRLTGPFGQGAAQLYGDKQQATLESSEQATVSGSSAGQLLAQQLGWPLPLEQLQFWIRGIPDPARNSTKSAVDNSNGFIQDDWQLSYPRINMQQQQTLPAKIKAEQTPLKVTLLIKQWQLQPNCQRATND